METFSYQDPFFLLDSVILPNTPIKTPGSFEFRDINTTYFPRFPLQPLHEVSVDAGSSAVERRNAFRIDTENSVCGKQKTYSSSKVVRVESGDQVIQTETQKMDKKRRKNRDGFSSNSAQSKDVEEGKRKRQRKCNSASKKTEEKTKCDKNDEKKVAEEPPTSYVHVRARRGQATDSHSLAERARREKISERMKMLQGLVPGCDKITGKALMLDEIINYVQSLQYEVEFLSMKLASACPVFYDFGADLDISLPKPENPSSQTLPLSSEQAQVCCSTQPTTFVAATTTLDTTNNYLILDSSVDCLLQPGQKLNAHVFSQGNGNSLWDDAENQIQKFTTQPGFNTFRCFQQD
ncbi:PREDICTED: transcription factor bHLH137-like [Nelumbo nucifera]|uniref:BHLH domain-containing protein n=2 Tax=Nelumbo nucifera TaxID=4432 RepID=A0A822YHP5_NELNU|nr:PREDICTED: transcription factor bHLH137-like [Nelumbo nucifera]DAD30446.1 TPA_asm: hypothetical protein HUJ06_009297 [Nelumbo nucifera]